MYDTKFWKKLMSTFTVNYEFNNNIIKSDFFSHKSDAQYPGKGEEISFTFTEKRYKPKKMLRGLTFFEKCAFIIKESNRAAFAGEDTVTKTFKVTKISHDLEKSAITLTLLQIK